MTDRLLTSLARIASALSPRLRLMVWEYRVQNVSAVPPITVDAIPAGASPFGRITGIKLRPGPDGSVAVPAVGSLVDLAFAEGDAGKPRIVGLDPEQPPTMVYVGGAVGLAAARQTDAISWNLTSVIAALIVAPNGGGPCTLPAGTVAITGTITGGSAAVQST